MVMGDAARVTDGSDLRMNLEDDLMIVCRCLMIARCVKLKQAVVWYYVVIWCVTRQPAVVSALSLRRFAVVFLDFGGVDS